MGINEASGVHVLHYKSLYEQKFCNTNHCKARADCFNVNFVTQITVKQGLIVLM
jgi:hypothetical protein